MVCFGKVNSLVIFDGHIDSWQHGFMVNLAMNQLIFNIKEFY